jgi:hypothetical protein
MHDAAFWSVAEPAVAIINTCIATLRPILKVLSPTRIWGSNKARKSARGFDSGGVDSKRKSRNKVGVENDEHPLTRIEDGLIDVDITRWDGEVHSTRSDVISEVNTAIGSQRKVN